MLKVDINIMNHIQDEVSNKIYRERIAYNNGDFSGMEDIMSTVRGGN